ncbi:MAG: YtxH domain-containing protein [Candidatus Peregrinibacteria bacterium]|nr:YtxH domain-containing protein [Candidatus Peregrinibacteria bacterium]
MFNNKEKKRNGLLTGLIVGGAVGSVLSLLFATKKGRESVKKLPKDAYEKTKSTAENFLEKYKK